MEAAFFFSNPCVVDFFNWLYKINCCKHMKTVKDMRVGQKASVVKVHGEGALRRRIMDMGITKGVEIRLRKFAPLGDPMELTVRGYELSLRKADAEMIEIGE